MTPNRTGPSGLTRRNAVRAAGAAVVSGTLAGCLGDTGEDDGEEDEGPYEIGMVDSQTGTLAPYGERNERGKDLALDHINEVGVGADDRELEIMVEDSESVPESGVDAARVLVEQESVPLLIGAVGSGVSMAIHDSVIDGTDVVHISQNSTGAVLSERPNLLRTSPSGAEKGEHLADVIAADGHDEVAVTYVNNDYGVSLSDVFVENFDGDVPVNVAHEEEESTYSGELTEMEDSGAPAWLFITYADEFTIMVNEAYDRGYHEEFDYYGAESTIADTILENTPEASHDGLTGVTETAPVEEENYQRFEEAFEEAYDRTPTVWAAYAHDAVMMAAIAIHVADDFTGQAIGEVVREVTREPGETVHDLGEAKEIIEQGGDPDAINYHGVSGPLDIDDNGDPSGSYQLYHVEDHEYVWGDYLTG